MDGRAVCPEPMLVRFDSYEGRIAKGKLQSLRYQMPFEFNSLDQLFMIIEEVLDSIQFPRGAGGLRNLNTGTWEPEYLLQSEGPKGCAEGKRVAGGSGFCGQMTVEVHRREHSSMQGTVNIDGEKTNFRSMLELMHMLYEYLDCSFKKG